LAYDARALPITKHCAEAGAHLQGWMRFERVVVQGEGAIDRRRSGVEQRRNNSAHARASVFVWAALCECWEGGRLRRTSSCDRTVI
jgi:hypothetical protein